jgi:hypothetical protein
MGVADRLAEARSPFLELLHREPRSPGAVAALIDRHLLLATGGQEGLALSLEGVEPDAGLPESLDVPARPDRHGGLLHRVAEVTIPIDQTHEHAPHGCLVPLDRSEVLSCLTEEIARGPLQVVGHRGRAPP